MDTKKKNSFITLVGVIAALTLIAGFVTASFSFANLDSKLKTAEKNWDIYFTEPMVDSSVENNIIVTGSNIDFSVDLRNGIKTYSFETSINNDGDMDAVLSNIKMTNFNEIVVGRSEVGTKRLSDFFDLKVTYYQTSKDNGVIEGREVSLSDRLKSGTNNKIKVEVSLKQNLNLSEEEKEILTNISTLNIYINLIYSELK